MLPQGGGHLLIATPSHEKSIPILESPELGGESILDPAKTVELSVKEGIRNRVFYEDSHRLKE
jgi:hypothetical protein